MNKVFKIFPVVALFVGASFMMTNKTNPIRTDAIYNNEVVTIYLDKTTTIAGLGWWETDETYAHVWDGNTDIYQQMVKVSPTLFTYDMPADKWALFTESSRGIEFYVYNKGSDQNQTYFTDGAYLKNNELNYFILKSANEATKQSFEVKNYQVEQVISEISTLTCSSTQIQVQAVVDKYDALRALGKTNLNTWEVDTGVTWYQRLSYLAQRTGATFGGSSQNYYAIPQNNNLVFLAYIGIVIGLSSLAGFYLLKTKKQ